MMNLGLVMTLGAFLRKLRFEESGQDLAEYCLLTALLTLAAAAILVQASGGIQAIWGTANSSLVAGNTSVSTANGTASPARTPAR
jgi:Flp pilus assembly pilin Flp